MSTHKNIDKICCAVMAVTLILTVIFMNAEWLGVQKASYDMGYEKKLFDTSRVHTINIIMDNWDEFIADCQNEEYYNCTVVIDNDAYKNVAIRAKGNTSLTQVAAYGNDRYSFKIEFDHYDSTNSYYGLDKLCLNNIIQDNTYMKDYLTYQLMGEMGVSSSLCSYAYICVNGEEWGLYLAVEGVEESFLQRNYGKNYGELYKPDSMSMGAGRGNGEKFDMKDFMDKFNMEDYEGKFDVNDGGFPKNNMSGQPQKSNDMADMENPQRPDGMEGMENPQRPDGMEGMENPQRPDGMADMENPQKPDHMDNFVGTQPFKNEMFSGSDDVLLKYIDDEFESYSNIFDNAKTDISDSDKSRLIESLRQLSDGEKIEEIVDIQSVINYFVVHNFVLNFDSYTGGMIHNYYLYESDGQMQMIPWDYNLAFGGFENSEDVTSLVNYPIDSPVSGGNVQDRPMIAWIFGDLGYTQMYHESFDQFISQYFESGYFGEMIDEVTEMISLYVKKDPTKFCTYDEFMRGAETLKEFCMLRAESIRGQLDGTIGSESDTQTRDTLIDADNIKISDMGSMNGSMGKVMKSRH